MTFAYGACYVCGCTDEARHEVREWVMAFRGGEALDAVADRHGVPLEWVDRHAAAVPPGAGQFGRP